MATRGKFGNKYAILKFVFLRYRHYRQYYTFNFEIKYAKICTGIFGAKVLTNEKQVFQLSYALNNLSKERFFDLIRTVFFEKRLSCVFIGIQFLSSATTRHLFIERNDKTTKIFTGVFGAKVLTNAKQIFYPSCALKYLSKEILFASIRSALSEETTFKQVRNSSLGTFIQGNGMTSILQLRRSTHSFPAQL